jgi:hypothetical protein
VAVTAHRPSKSVVAAKLGTEAAAKPHAMPIAVSAKLNRRIAEFPPSGDCHRELL